MRDSPVITVSFSTTYWCGINVVMEQLGLSVYMYYVYSTQLIQTKHLWTAAITHCCEFKLTWVTYCSWCTYWQSLFARRRTTSHCKLCQWFKRYTLWHLKTYQRTLRCISIVYFVNCLKIKNMFKPKTIILTQTTLLWPSIIIKTRSGHDVAIPSVIYTKKNYICFFCWIGNNIAPSIKQTVWTSLTLI